MDEPNAFIERGIAHLQQLQYPLPMSSSPMSLQVDEVKQVTS